MLEALSQIDHSLTLSINQAHNEIVSAFMIAVSNKLTWIPLYLGLLLLLNKIYGWKRALVIVIAIVANVVLTDQTSVMMKEYFMRLRPCHQVDYSALLNLPSGCGGKFGFVSSHAANTMGLAVLFSMIIKNRWMTIGMLGFALLNGYSRIYLGKHFLFDIIGGFFLGSLCALAIYYTLKWAIKTFRL